MGNARLSGTASARTPIVFPAIVVAHFGWLLWTIWDFRSEPFPSPIWVAVAWHCLYTLAWALAWKGLRIGAWAYLGLTSLNLVFCAVLTDWSNDSYYTSPLFPFDILFSFFLLLYHKRFR